MIGRSGPQVTTVEWDAAALTQNTQGGNVNSCQKSYTYSVQPFAVQFGDLPKSYVRLDYDRHIFHSKNTTIELTFRTFYLDGVLLIIPVSLKIISAANLLRDVLILLLIFRDPMKSKNIF